jgi:hypothetical protein
VEFTLKIGSLPTFKEDQGVRARLRSLGFGISRGSDGERTRKSVELFQRNHLKQNSPSGRVSDVRDDVRDRHDNL